MSARWKGVNWVKPVPVHNVPTRWHWLTLYPEGLKLGDYVDIGSYTILVAKEGITLEDFVQIGGHCCLYSVNTIDDTRGEISVKKNAKIGAHSVILPNVTIGENSIIGAFSLVKQDVPANEIWANVPAKKIGVISDGKNIYGQQVEPAGKRYYH